MNTFNKEFDNYISERINDNLARLKEEEAYKKIYTSYAAKLDSLKSELNNTQKNMLDNILSYHSMLSNYEINIGYSVGLVDGIELKNRTNI